MVFAILVPLGGFRQNHHVETRLVKLEPAPLAPQKSTLTPKLSETKDDQLGWYQTYDSLGHREC